MIYETFLPNYYGTLIAAQQQALYLDNLYFYVADGVTENATANTKPKTLQDEQITVNQIMYGGKLYPQNMIAMVKRVDWVPGLVFAQYDSRDPELDTKNFYAMNSQRVVYKCLDNNNGTPSTLEPISVEQGPFRLADGYVWQYMYKLTENDLLNYAVGQYIPLIKDANTAAAAIRGTVSSIKVVDGGNYDATNDGTILQVQSNTVFRISDSADPASGIYQGMGFFVSDGVAAGKVSQIDEYTANTTGKWITTTQPLTGIALNSAYSIAPYVQIRGNGFQATARAIMNGKRVGAIEVLNRGQEYTLASATLVANASYSTAGVLETNLSPIRGHGSDAFQELYADAILVNVEMDNYTIGANFPVNEISFSKTGLVRRLVREENPTQVYNENAFNNTFMARVTPSFGEYKKGDKVTLATPSNLVGDVVYANSTHIIGVYESPLLRFAAGNIIVNQDGVSGNILNIDQPQIKLIEADIVSITNTDTIVRDENSRETLQLVIRIK